MSTETDPACPPCPTCGAPIPEGSPGGLCPACVLEGSRTEIAPPEAAAPSVDQIAEAFPELEILGLVGRGGMGAVYHARQPKLDRELALKVLLPDLGADPAFAERFTREARALAKLNHPNIVAVYDFGEQDGLFYLAMEYVDGVNLRQAMAAGRFTPEQALAVIPGICDALGAAHKLGILHRDIKPENILLDREGKVKIVDFGIARMVGDSAPDFTLTEPGSVLGSRQYMAPEQLERSHEVDHRADIYSLGVVFYEMLTGELPMGRFLPPSEKGDAGHDIDAIVMRALEKELDRRFQNVGQVKTQVELAGRQPSPRRRPPPPARTASPMPAFPSKSGEVAGVPKLTLGSLGLSAAGAALGIPGGAMLESRQPGLGILLLAAGILIGTAGYVGCQLSLKAIRRREIAPVARGWLYLVAIGVPSFFVAAFAATIAGGSLHDYGKGAIFLTMIASLVPTFLIADLCVRATGFGMQNARARSWGWRGMGLLLAGLGVHAGLNDGRWPWDHMKRIGYVELATSMGTVDSLQLHEAIQTAAGPRMGAYSARDHGERVEVTVLHELRSEANAIAHIEAFGQRLLASLPAEIAAWSSVNTSGRYGHRSRIFDSRMLRGELISYGMFAAAAGFGLALLGGRTGWLALICSVAAFGVMIFLPHPPYPKNGLQLVDGPPLEPIYRPPTEIDLSTPEAALRSLMRARVAEDFHSMRSVFSETNWHGETPKSFHPTESLMRSIPMGVVTAITRDDARSRPEQVTLQVVLKTPRSTRNLTYGFALEDGEWRFVWE